MPFTIAPFYNVQYTVGRGGTNYPTDVMLVQYMIWKTCVQSSPYFGRNDGIFAPYPVYPPDVDNTDAIQNFDGFYTPELGDWIEAFQLAANQRGFGTLTVDGRVARAPVGWGKNARAGVWYTIQALNLLMFRQSEQPYANLPDLSDVPVPMGDQLKLIVVEDWG